MLLPNFLITKSCRFYHILFYASLLLASVCLAGPPTLFSAEITLAWDPNTEPFLSGYKLYYGTSSGTYTVSVDAGKKTEFVVSGLTPGHTYYFAATAYDALGNESGYSAELIHTIPNLPVDSDGDGITDADETTRFGTDPHMADSDGDGIDDGDELNYWGENWNSGLEEGGTNKLLDSDSDGDGKSDGWEIINGYDPTDPLDNGVTIYEDADDNTTLGWDIYDNTPAGAVIRNEFDPQRRSHVIDVSGSKTNNSYRLRNRDGSLWKNTSQFLLQWSMNYSEAFMIYIDVQTSVGHRYLVYHAAGFDLLGNGEYVFHGLEYSYRTGGWQTFTRDLQDDLDEAQPGAKLLEVNSFIIRGSGKIDDIKLMDCVARE